MVAAENKVIFLMGPTASGKTGIAIELHRLIGAEIISVDSAMVYKGMDIGTAKPTKEELELAPHRLIDFLDPAEAYSAADFVSDSKREISGIQSQNKIPLLAGGTMLYFRSLQYGLSELPAADSKIREKIESEAGESGWGELHNRLAEIDPISAERIHPNDPQRIGRALEIYEITGKPMSQICEESEKEGLNANIVKIALHPPSREELHEKIEKRFHMMLEQGLIDEVENLKRRGDLDLSKPSMRCVGYRQVWEYLDGNLNYDEMVERSVIATRQLAKRQITWLRAEENLQWLDAADPDIFEKINDILSRN